MSKTLPTAEVTTNPEESEDEQDLSDLHSQTSSESETEAKIAAESEISEEEKPVPIKKPRSNKNSPVFVLNAVEMEMYEEEPSCDVWKQLSNSCWTQLFEGLVRLWENTVFVRQSLPRPAEAFIYQWMKKKVGSASSIEEKTVIFTDHFKSDRIQQIEGKSAVRLVLGNSLLGAAFYPRLIPPELIKILWQSTMWLWKGYPKVIDDSPRGMGIFFNLGVCPRNAAKSQPLFVDEKHEAVKKWQGHNALLFAYLKEFIKRYHPHLFETAKVSGIEGPYFPFTSGQINYHLKSTVHVDKKDYHGGMNLVIPFGKYSNGALRLRNIECDLLLQPCDVGLIYGKKIFHEVLDLKSPEEVRHSLILYLSASTLEEHIKKNLTKSSK